MRKRVYFALAVLLVTLAGLIAWQVLRERESIRVVGNLSNREVEDITKAVRSEFTSKYRPPVFRDFSWQSIREVPVRFRYRFGTRILSIEERTRGFVAVITGLSENAPDEGCVFWSVFREPDGWKVTLGGRLGNSYVPGVY